MANILLVDDDHDVSTILQCALKADGHTVLIAHNGRAALAVLSGWLADLVITDISMPDKDGVELMLDLRKMLPEVPVIAMSGHRFGQAFLKIGRQLGAVKTLYKPFSTKALLTAVHELAASTETTSPPHTSAEPTFAER